MHTLIDIFNSFAKRQQNIAFVYRTGIRRFTYSYEQLSLLSLKFNTWLDQQNIKSGDRVALWAPNSPWWGVVYWGCVTRGVIVVPIDFMSGRERAEKIIEHSGSKLVIQSQYKIDRFDRDSKFIEIEQLEYLLNNLEPADIVTQFKTEDVVEIVYTSGTTGNPKGVALTHKNLMANLEEVLKQIEIKPEYTFLSLLPLSHMFEQSGGFLAPLKVGGRVVYLRTIKPAAMSDALQQEDINVMMAVPRILQAFRDGVVRELSHKKLIGLFNYLTKKFSHKPKQFKSKLFFPIHKKFGSNFQFFASGGASLDIMTFKFWQDLGFTIIEGYGLTECSPVLTINRREKQVAGSVGVTLPGIDLRIHEGEIQARGDSIFSGYWDNPQATQAAFTNDGWFKTGDIGDFDKDGNLFIKGRSKEMIVTAGGINVYPDEVEEVINAIPGVVESCVVGYDQGRGEEVNAVLILEEGKSLQEVIKNANQQLDPKQRVTSYSVWPSSTFPKTTTLKIKKFEVKEQIKDQTSSRVHSSIDKLKIQIAFVVKKPASKITDQSRLVADLGLSSIARLELANLIELEYRLDLDDSVITPETTVSDLQHIVTKRISQKHTIKSRRWVHGKLVRRLRYYFNKLVVRWFMMFLFSVKSVNTKNLDLLTGPAIFIANHASYLDGPGVYMAMPKKWQINYSTVIYEGFFFKKKNLITKAVGRFWFEFISFTAGVFLATENNGFRKVLEFMGHLIERQISILVFPEGERSWDNKLLPFKPGLGQMVKELKVPVVPIKISGSHQVLPRGAFWPKRGPITVEFGKPLYFSQESPSEIVIKTKQAIEDM